jgi:hypothetical protein
VSEAHISMVHRSKMGILGSFRGPLALHSLD